MKMVSKDQFQLLHISDLHIKDDPNKKFNRQLVLQPLIKRVEEDLQEGFSPEIVVVTGDIAFKGFKNEYAIATSFFSNLMDSLQLKRKHLFIVPGNHDVNRKRYRPKDIPLYADMNELNRELEDDYYRQDLLKGMDDYYTFIETNYRHLKSLKNRLVPFVHHYQAQCGRQIKIIGLNSAWMCRRFDDKNTIAIGEYQIVNAMQAAKPYTSKGVRLVMLHHPLEWLWPIDRNISRPHLENAFILTGHLHSPEGGFRADLEGGFFSFQAGGAYLATESDYPCRFHYLTLDWEKNIIRLDFRKFVSGKRRWQLDGDIGNDGVKEFSMFFPGPSQPIKSSPSFKIPSAYVLWIKTHCQYMDLDYLQVEGKAVRADLPETFIPLYTHSLDHSSIKSNEFVHGERKPVNIESLFEQCPYLLIEGEAGSGKTTLLKHMALCLTQKHHSNFPARRLSGRLPVLIFLKDLRPLYEIKTGQRLPVTVEDILLYYTQHIAEGLELAIIKRFAQTHQVIFLLDGLDEMVPEHRQQLVKAFAVYSKKPDTKENKIILAGRPHGVSGVASKSFGRYHATILPLNQQQVKLFIQHWFEFIYPDSTGMASKTAHEMISQVRSHPSIDQLIDNPLMLTATCILYYAGKTLPGQRAELYDLFIKNLLHRRFTDPEEIKECLSILAYRMFKWQLRSANYSLIIKVLAKVYPIKKNESEVDYHIRLKHIFDTLEPRCGLLLQSKKEFTFRHLIFQEFLTAQYLVENSTDYVKAIATYWDIPRYEEVIELYVGYLSIQNKRWANSIVETAIVENHKKKFERRLLASRALLNIRPKRRTKNLVNLTSEKLLKIFKDESNPLYLADAGETLGRLGDPRNLECFVAIFGGAYKIDGKRNIKIDPFQISKYLVTNQWYGKFMEAGGYINDEFWDAEGLKWRIENKISSPLHWHDWHWNCPNAPVVGVSSYEVEAFCKWLTLSCNDGYHYRLPEEKEWEAAAAGFEKRKYPWGKKWVDVRCNTAETKIGKTSSVGIFANGATPEKISDLAGNVFEWTISNYKEQRYALRGGCWEFGKSYAQCTDRNIVKPDARNYNIGFRCIKKK